MSRGAVIFLLFDQHSWRMVGKVHLPSNDFPEDDDPAPAHISQSLQGKGPAAAQRAVMDWTREIIPPGSSLARLSPLRPTGDCGCNSRFVRQSLRFSTQHLRNVSGEAYGSKQISGTVVSIWYLEGVAQGGQSASVSGWRTAQTLVY